MKRARLHKEHLACFFWVLAELSSADVRFFCWACHQGDVAHRLEANGVGNPSCFHTWQDNGKLFPVAGWLFQLIKWFLTCKGKVCLLKKYPTLPTGMKQDGSVHGSSTPLNCGFPEVSIVSIDGFSSAFPRGQADFWDANCPWKIFLRPHSFWGRERGWSKQASRVWEPPTRVPMVTVQFPISDSPSPRNGWGSWSDSSRDEGRQSVINHSFPTKWEGIDFRSYQNLLFFCKRINE